MNSSMLSVQFNHAPSVQLLSLNHFRFFFLRDLLYFAMVPATAWQQYLLSRCLQFTVWFHLLYDNMWKVHGNIIENTYLLFTHWLFRLAEITECTQDIQSVVFSSVLESEVQHKSIQFYDSVEVSNPPILVISTLGVFLFFFFFFFYGTPGWMECPLFYPLLFLEKISLYSSDLFSPPYTNLVLFEDLFFNIGRLSLFKKIWVTICHLVLSVLLLLMHNLLLAVCHKNRKWQWLNL